MDGNSHISPRSSPESLNGKSPHLTELRTQVADEKPHKTLAAQGLVVPLLAANGLCKSFGGIRAVNDAEINVVKGSITGLIGPNGAGKTTLFNLLSNFIHPDKGRVIFDGEPIENLQTHQIAQMGMVRTFQVARVLSRLSVLENMLLAAQKTEWGELLASLVATPAGSPRRTATPGKGNGFVGICRTG